MYLEIKQGGWGFVEEDVGLMVKVVSLIKDGEYTGAVYERNSALNTEGDLNCILLSFLEEGSTLEEAEDLEKDIRLKLDLAKSSKLSVMTKECRSPYCECDVGNCNTGRIDKRGEPLKSDGGSSLYYDLPIPQKLLDTLVERSEQGDCYIKTEEIITHLLANSFDYGNLFKSLIRCKGLQDGTGGKAGNSVDYECNKMSYSVEKIREMGNNKEK